MNSQQNKEFVSLLENGLEGYFVESQILDNQVKLSKIGIQNFRTKKCHSAIFDKNGSNIIYTCSQIILIAKLQNLQFIQQLEGHKAQINQLLLSQDDNVLISCSNDKTIILWRYNEVLQKWYYLNTFEKHTDSISSMILNKNETQLLTASADNSIIVWSVNLKTNQIDYQYTLQHHKHEVNFLSLNPSENYLISYSKDKTIAFWSLNKGNNWQFRYVITQFNFDFGAKLKFLSDQMFIFVTNQNHEDSICFYELNKEKFEENINKRFCLQKCKGQVNKSMDPIILNQNKNLIIISFNRQTYVLRRKLNGDLNIIFQESSKKKRIFSALSNDADYMIINTKNGHYCIFQLEYY
ncbi:unnamed protein product [Paramecium sonneborni]|uniref:Uncharacterized protein n=1 Tax=Paramecium sonneborni TaxID=65129 RepID=A0A8S1RKJ6_9CILI|nr:unnamed protein product [Paramecium sonneborni]